MKKWGGGVRIGIFTSAKNRIIDLMTLFEIKVHQIIKKVLTHLETTTVKFEIIAHRIIRKLST